MIRFNAQGNLISCADNIQFVTINVLPFKSSSQRSLLLHLYGADSMRANFRELLSGSMIRHCCKKTVHWSQRSCHNSLSLWLWSRLQRTTLIVSSSGADGKACVILLLTRSTRGSNLPFGELFFLPFQIQITSEKHLFFNKNEGNNQKVENNVSGRVRVECREGFIDPIRWHPFTNLN